MKKISSTFANNHEYVNRPFALVNHKHYDEYIPLKEDSNPSGNVNFTGEVTAITLDPSDNSDRIATTAFVHARQTEFLDEPVTLTNKILDDYTNIIHADTLHERVKNNSGGPITRGQPVKYVGFNPGENAIEIALANSAAGDIAIGIADDTTVNGEFSMLTMAGVMDNVDTSAYAEGVILYVNGAGVLSAVEPALPAISQPIAYVLRSHAITGALQVLASYPKQTATDVRYSGLLAATNVSSALDELATDFGNLGTASAYDVGVAENQIPLLGAGGILPTNLIPPLAITDPWPVASEAAQLALVVQKGDLAIRTDISKTYVALNSTNATMADWQEMLSPTDAVTSVDGRIGVITLNDLYSGVGHNHNGVYETVLGNPAVDGYILSSTVAGVRSWVDSGLTAQNAHIADGSIHFTQAAINITLSQVSDSGTAAALNTGVLSGNVPLIGAGNVLPTSILPALAITTPYPVVSEAAQLALTVQQGDVAIRTDINKTYIALNSANATMADWQEMLTPTDAVTSVDGRTGVIALSDLYAPIAHSNDVSIHTEDALLMHLAGAEIVTGAKTFNANIAVASLSSGNTYLDDAYVETGRGSGSVALTINDGYGNANLTFNHRNGTPDISGSSGRITVSVDGASAVMSIQVKDNTVSGVPVSLTQVVGLTPALCSFYKPVSVTGNIILTGTVDGRDIANDGTAQDTHIADGTIHYAQSAISITESQISDLQSYSEKLTADRTYYVDGSLGSDSNDGLSSGAGAFATIQKALDVISEINPATYQVTIDVADGTYTENVHCAWPQVGSSEKWVKVVGDSVTPSNVVIDGSTTGASIKAGSGCKVEFDGFKVTNNIATDPTIFTHHAGTLLVLKNMEYGSSASYHMAAGSGSTILIDADYSITGGAVSHLVADTGLIHSHPGLTATITGTPNFSGAFAFSTNGGTINFDTPLTFSGAATGTRYIVEKLSLITTNNSGATYFPGNADGNAKDGGLYDGGTYGTFTPILTFGGGSTGITYSLRGGNYKEVNEVVHVSIGFILTNKGSSTGVAQITGLPFQVVIDGAGVSSINIGMSGLTASPIIARAVGGSTSVDLNAQGASGTVALTDANFTNGSGIYVNFSYFK